MEKTEIQPTTNPFAEQSIPYIQSAEVEMRTIAIHKPSWFDGLLKLLSNIFSDLFSSSDCTELDNAIKNSNQNKVTKIISQIPNANPKDETEWTPLHYACRDGNILLVKALIERLESENIILDGQSKFLKITPLELAVLNGHEEIVGLLISHNANPNLCVDSGGWTILHTASRNNNSEITQLLCENKVDIDAQTFSSHETALHIACRMGNLEIVKILISFGANLNSTDSHGRRPIDLASDEEIRKILSSPSEILNETTTNNTREFARS